MDEHEPSEEEMINMRNEAGEINEMVDKDIVSRDQASTFDYETEIDISTSLLQEPPKLSERLKQ